MTLPRQSPSRAFTLLEILIAITVFTLLMIGIMACWKCIINGTQTGEAAAAAAQRVRNSMRAIEDALNNMEIQTSDLPHYAFIADTSSQYGSLSVAARLPASFLGSGYFGDNVMRRVTFAVQKGSDDTPNLVMTQYPVLAVMSEQNPPYTLTLARDVSIFTLEFWSPKEQDWMTEFLPTNEVPPMIRVTLGLGHSGNNGSLPYDIITRVIAPMQQPHT